MNKRVFKVFIFLLALILLLSACGGEAAPDGDGVEISVYRVIKEEYRSGDSFVRAELLSSGDSQIDTLVKGASYALMSAPEDVELTSAIPSGVRIVDTSFSGRTVSVTVNEGYTELSRIEKTILDTCVTLTMCSIPGVDYVSFINEDGEALGSMSSEDILLKNTTTSDKLIELRLYFPKVEENLLACEYRQVSLDEDMPVERHIIDELVKGPQNDRLRAVLPENTAVLSVYTQDGLCTVSFSENFMSGEEYEPVDIQLAVYSIVNSITCLSTVDRVQISVRNNTEQKLGDFDISLPFARRNSVIGSIVEQ